MNKERFLHHYTRVLLGTTFLLIVMGALVTSTGSGLAVPDWPLSFGTFFPSMTGGVFFEHSHRLVAGTVTLLTLALAILIWRWEKRGWMRGLGFAALGLVLAQALLGGLTVLLKLPPVVSIAHACMAQTFFCIVVTLVIFTAPDVGAPLVGAPRAGTRPAPTSGDATLATLSWTTTAMLFLQLILGAIVRHTGHALHYHVIGAGLILLLIVATIACSESRVEAPGGDGQILLILGLTIFQLGLGITIGFVHRTVWATAVHVGVGALILASSLILSLKVGPSGPRWKSFIELTKPRITMMVLMTALGGFLLGRPETFHSFSHFRILLHLLAGLSLVVGGANGLNQYLERELDAQMRRTCTRPLPQKRLRPWEALVFCLAITLVGLAELAFSANHISALLAWVAVVAYVWVYTPLKRKTFLSTLVGAVPGAMPPVIGWVAGGRSLSMEPMLLFFIMFLWQLPHFLSIAWIYREDYGRAGFPMLPVLDPQGHRTSRHIIFWCLVLLPVSLLPSFFGITGISYFIGALALGLGLLGFGVSLAKSRSSAGARRLFLASDIYLPTLFAFLLLGMVLP